MNPFIRNPLAYQREPIRASVSDPKVEGSTAVFRLYDPIDSYGGPWGVSAKEFADALDALDESVDTIELRVNSPGGEVWEGLAILNALRSHRARVVAVVDGVAASAASFICCGVDELVMARNSELFVHCAWGLCVGNAADMAKMADDLAHEDRNIASIYAAKAGGELDEWLAAMAGETWYSADEAVAAGLADRVDSASEADDSAKNRFDLSVFHNRRQPPAVPVSATPPSPSPPAGQKKGGSMPELTPEHLALLGLTEEAGAEDIMARLEELTAEPEPPDAPPALPDGVVAIDEEQLAELRAQAAAGVEAREEQMRQRRETLVAAAVSDGRIPPARREHWLNQLAVDPGSEQVLAGLQKGLIPVEQIGSGGNVDLDADDALYAQLFGQEVSHG